MLTLLIQLIIVLAVVGLVLYLISLIPMDAAIHQIIRVAVLVIVVIWLLSVLLGYLPAGNMHLLR